MEPEREIEKLLRAYVAKRRAAAGDPLKLHPATRRLLQGEVARHAPKPETEEVSFSFWQLFRQQWVFLLGFALMIFLGATLLLPGLSSAKRKAESVSAMNNLRQIGVAAQMAAEDNHGRLPASLDELSNTLGTRAVLTDSISGKPFVYIAGGKDLKTLSSNAVLAYSPENKNGRAVLFADGRVALVANGDFDGLMNQTPVEFALADKVAREDLAKTAVNAPAAAAAPPPSHTRCRGHASSCADGRRRIWNAKTRRHRFAIICPNRCRRQSAKPLPERIHRRPNRARVAIVPSAAKRRRHLRRGPGRLGLPGLRAGCRGGTQRSRLQWRHRRRAKRSRSNRSSTSNSRRSKTISSA